MKTDTAPMNDKTGLPLLSEEEKGKASHLKTMMLLVVFNAIGLAIGFSIYYFGSKK